MTGTQRSSRPPLVLIVNDQEWSARSLESVIGPRGYAVLRAYTAAQAMELARTARPDAVIMDLQMPDANGIDLCRSLHTDARVPPNVAIFVTTAGGDTRGLRLAAYNAGAWDFCTEPVDVEVLLAKLETFVQAKLAADRMMDESLVDQESGLYNMRGLARRAREVGAEATRRSKALACVVFAPEAEAVVASSMHFGSAAETTSVAAHIGTVCRKSARASDVVGRLGPSEYAIIAPATEETGAARLVERLVASFDAAPLDIGGEPRRMHLRTSYAAVPNLAESPMDAVELLLRATSGLRQSRTSQPNVAVPHGD